MNENILLSFFPANAHEHQQQLMDGSDEETKNGDFYDMVMRRNAHSKRIYN